MKGGRELRQIMREKPQGIKILIKGIVSNISAVERPSKK